MYTFTCQGCSATFYSSAREPLVMVCQHCGSRIAPASAGADGPVKVVDLRVPAPQRRAS